LLAPVRLPDDPRVIVSTATSDDAGVIRVRPDLALVQTVDFFPPVVDDPAWYGRIAAANSLSDVYAMGGEPLCAVSVFAFPVDVPDGVPSAILIGAVETCAEAGCALVGGHTVKDPEIKFGLAVTGTIHPDRVVTNAAARGGDRLVLTKPLGSGFLTTALRADVLDAETTRRVQEVMACLNRAGAEAMVEVGVSAATDVTGFGLLGHAYQMALSSGVTIRLEADRIPWIEGLAPYVDPRFACGGLNRNREYADRSGRVRWRGGTEAQRMVIADPQTSGGLLISVPEDRLPALLGALERRGVATRAVIGSVVPKTEATLEVV
jgi:selenide,water dikinase